MGGFDREGKSIVIQQLISELTGCNGQNDLSLVLNELGEAEARGSENDSYEIHIEDLRGGCLCCSMEGDLKRVLRSEVVERSDVVMIEVAGACDLENLKSILSEMDSSVKAISYLVLEATSFRALLEIVPVFKHNIAASDRLFITHADRAGAEDLKELMGIFFGDHMPVIAGEPAVEPGKYVPPV